MTGIFLRIAEMSLSASWIVLAVIAARLVLKKAPKWMMCALWALVALRLVCPFTPESALSLIPELDFSQEVSSSARDSGDEEILAVYSRSPETVPAGETGNMTGFGVITDSNGNVLLVKDLQKAEVEAERNLSQIFSTLWLIGIGILAAYAAISYLRIRKKVSASIDLGTGVYICDYIDTPFILGILKPKIYLSSAMDPADAAYVLAHERAHLKRKDHWWKPLGFALLCLHWFNPLLWLAYILLCQDIELACDERVVKDMGSQEKKDYSDALLKCSVPRHMIAACPLAFGEVGVKQRVKSVLHYKKPGFWIVLVSVIVIIVVAVCFLTDPESHTLANIMDIQSDEIEQILLWSRTSRADFETEEKIKEFLDFLDTLEYDPTPAASEPIEGELDENNWSYQTIDIYYKDRTEYILFNYDYSLVWTRDADGKNSLPYRMKDPQRLLNYLNDYVTPVNNRETYAEPFAAWDQPAKWLRGISLDAIRAVSADNGYLNIARTSELTSILNSIPETAVGSQRFVEDFTFDYRFQSMPYILLRDDSNNLTGILTYFDDFIELSLVGSSDYGMYPWKETQHSGYICTIDSDALRSFFKELTEDPPNLLASSASGYIFNEKLEVVSDGDFTMSFHTLENWDYEIIRPEDGEDFFGVRCKPKKEEDGWITFSWWGDGFTPASTEEESQSNANGYHYTYFTGSTNGEDGDIRYSRSHCDHGDFVTIYENTDSWAQWYQEVATWLYAFMNVKCETNHTLTEIPDEILSELVNVAYYDWDSIAREIGTEHMTLFSPQYYEDYLFVGCQYENSYRVACFRKIEGYDYEFVELLTPFSKALPNDSTQTVPVAELETEDSPWYLYIIEDETVTGVKCNAGFWAYIPVDAAPSLVVLDEALWNTDGEATVAFDLCYDDPPMLDFHAETSGSSAEFTESPQYYLYSCIVNYNDGANHLGTFSLETEELWELSSLLRSLPMLTENVFPEYDEESFELFSEDGSKPRFRAELLLGSYYQYLWSDRGIVQEDFGAVRLTLYYCDGSITLGVNMTDLGNDYYADVYYFKVESPELEAFMLSKCDDSRKQFSLSAEYES